MHNLISTIQNVFRKDGLSYKRRKAIKIIVTRTKSGELLVIGILLDRLKETVKLFLESTAVNFRRTVKTVFTDMYYGFVQAVAIGIFGNQAAVID